MAWNVHDYPEPQEEKPLAACDGCHDELTPEVFFADGQVLCSDCFKELLSGFSAEELADAFGYEHTTLEEFQA